MDLDSYYYPYFGSQITFEITREDVDDEKRSKLTYSDYTVKYYFNDDLLLSVPFNEFVEKVEKNIWSLEDIDKFCFGENYTKNNNENKANEDNNSVDTNLIIIMIMGIIIFILVIVIIYLTVKLMHKDNDSKDEQLIKDERIINEDD